MDVLIKICVAAFIAGDVAIWVLAFRSWRIQIGTKRVRKASAVHSNALDAYRASLDAFKYALDERQELLNAWQIELDERDRAAHQRRVSSN